MSSDVGNIIPGWTGFNSQLVANIPGQSNIGYLPIINSPATDMATVNAVLKQSISISQQLQIPEIVLVFDQTIYAKVQMIRWKEEGFTNKTFVVTNKTYNYVALQWNQQDLQRCRTAGISYIVIITDTIIYNV